MNWLIYGMVYLGSALMVYNVYSYVRYARHLQHKKDWGRERAVLHIPIVLLTFFLAGYLAVAFFGHPDLIVSGILFGGSIFVFVICRLLWFITDRVQENERLEAKILAAEEAAKVKTDFLSRVSHEMRTPMNAIIGLNAIARKDPDLSLETAGYLKKIGISAGHLMNLIDNVLEMNDIDSGSAALRQETFSVKRVMEALNELFEVECMESGLEYKTAVVGSLDDFYSGDETALRQILYNILENAVKFTPAPGTVTFTAEQIAAEGDRRTLRFVISDTGIGISSDFMERLYDPFAQEDMTVTDRSGGSGLGMAIVKNLVARMNGEISVNSRKGIRTDFTVTIPFGSSDQREEEAEPPVIPDDSDRSEKVLVAEDIDINAEILIELLRMQGITADRAENGKEAVRLFSESPENNYSAVLMDLRMPVMDGLEATRAIRALPRADAGTVPIIAVSANASEQDRANALEAGMNEHMAKPVDPRKLMDLLKRSFD